jgi:hypothetical protein
MPIRIRNRSPILLTVELNSGDSVHLAPDQTSRELPDVEVQANPWLDRLERTEMVTVQSADEDGPPNGSTSATKSARPAKARKQAGSGEDVNGA